MKIFFLGGGGGGGMKIFLNIFAGSSQIWTIFRVISMHFMVFS